jgi:hypothetical protein
MKAARIKRTELDQIADKIRSKAETIADIVEIGRLLIEAKGQLDHGDWLPWLEREFDFSERTAQNYISAYDFSLKYETVADLKLTPTALYSLAQQEDQEVIAAVLKEAAAVRVTRARVNEVVFEHYAKLEEESETVRPQEPESDDTTADDDADSILDGPPPDLPSAEPITPVDFLLPVFDQAIGKLKELSTKHSDKFLGSGHSASDIEAVAEFLFHVSHLKGKAAA